MAYKSSVIDFDKIESSAALVPLHKRGNIILTTRKHWSLNYGQWGLCKYYTFILFYKVWFKCWSDFTKSPLSIASSFYGSIRFNNSNKRYISTKYIKTYTRYMLMLLNIYIYVYQFETAFSNLMLLKNKCHFHTDSFIILSNLVPSYFNKLS